MANGKENKWVLVVGGIILVAAIGALVVTGFEDLRAGAVAAQDLPGVEERVKALERERVPLENRLTRMEGKMDAVQGQLETVLLLLKAADNPPNE